jgi:hypothetical protein
LMVAFSIAISGIFILRSSITSRRK